MSRPAAVALDDLANPVFPDEVLPIMSMLDDVGRDLVLDPQALLDAASLQTGLDDFGAPDFRERLELLCRCLTTEVALSPAGRAGQFAMLTGLLKSRLLLEDLIARHPEITDIPIARPIVICGLPRTGTTHLHNLISADPDLRSLPYWESLEPIPAPGEAADPDPRRERTEQAVWMINTAMPHFKRMHEMTVEHVHEEIQLLAIDFSTMLFETVAPMPSWRDAYLARDQRPSYAYLKRILQALTWLRGGDRWVLKSPQHLEQFPPLRDTFPDATFVVTHRDPVAVTLSLATMVTYGARMSQVRIDPARVGGYWADRVERMLRTSVEERDALPAAQSIDVRFDDFMADDIAMVRSIYDLADQPMTSGTLSAMDAFMDTHPRGRFGTVRYDFGVLGLDPAERRDALRFYADRFAVTSEATG